MMASNNIAPVILSDYDPSCPEKFQIEKVVLTKLIGERAKSIEHIGSTSVPDVVAKPEIDILVGLTNLSDAEPFIEILKDAGYTYYQRFEEFVPERRYFRKSEGTVPLVHVHVVETTSDFYEERIVFGDVLRSDLALRKLYIEFKLQLAKESGGDRLKYNKESFIRETLKNLRVVGEER